MTSDSITEQAARVVDETVMGRRDLIQNGRGSEVEGPLHFAIARALAAAGLLTNEAPAAEDEAAELACAWADYRADYGDSSASAHLAFKAGWAAHRDGDTRSALR